MKISKDVIKERLYNRRYYVPNALTLGNMFCGFLSIIYANSGRIEKAYFAIMIAILLDGLDGRVARRLNATTKFGIEFDSFSDLVSFGIAPAILIYNWCFKLLADEFGVFVCFIYALCAASRLARFNIAEPNPKGFVGMPTPGAAGMVATTVYLLPDLTQSITTVAAGAVLMLGLAYLMVSPVPYLKLKAKRRKRLALVNTLSLGALIALVWYYNRMGLFVLALSYTLSGPLAWLFQKMRSKSPDSDSSETVDEDKTRELKLMK